MNNKFLVQGLLITAMTFGSFVTYAGADDGPIVHQTGGLPYVSGGVGEESLQAILPTRKSLVDTETETAATEDEQDTQHVEDEFELESYVEMKEMKKIILGELDKMNYEQKEVYLLKEYGGLSYKEISETLVIDVDLVKSRLYKVRQKLINKISKMV